MILNKFKQSQILRQYSNRLRTLTIKLGKLQIDEPTAIQKMLKNFSFEKDFH